MGDFTQKGFYIGMRLGKSFKIGVQQQAFGCRIHPGDIGLFGNNIYPFRTKRIFVKSNAIDIAPSQCIKTRMGGVLYGLYVVNRNGVIEIAIE